MAQVHVGAMSYAKMLKEIELKPKTVNEVAEAVGLSPRTVRDYLFYLKKEQLVHVPSWAKDTVGRDCNPRYVLGFGVNVPRAKHTASERSLARHLRAAEGIVSTYHLAARATIEL